MEALQLLFLTFAINVFFKKSFQIKKHALIVITATICGIDRFSGAFSGKSEPLYKYLFTVRLNPFRDSISLREMNAPCARAVLSPFLALNILILMK